MIRARYMANPAVAGKHRRATDATNMSDDGASACRNSAPDQWVMTTFSPPGRHLFRWLRSAAFTTSGGVDGHASNHGSTGTQGRENAQVARCSALSSTFSTAAERAQRGEPGPAGRFESPPFTTQMSGSADGSAACVGNCGSVSCATARRGPGGAPHDRFLAGIKPGPLTLFLIDLAMGLCFNIIVLVTVVEILGAPL